MAKFSGQTIADQQVMLDGNEYLGCTFKDCELIYSGGAPPTLVNCTFDGFKLTFDGPAQRTLAFLTGLYAGGFQSVIEETFENIRGKPADRRGN